MNPAIILTWVVGICSFLAAGTAAGALTDLFDPVTAKKVAAAASLLGGVCAVPLGYFVTKGQQAAFVAQNIESPQVKVPLVQAVANLEGVNPLKINANASEDLKKLAASAAPENSKIT